jgi:8-oxo-dGTP pyrophosphatase MutT (NUDIX family)
MSDLPVFGTKLDGVEYVVRPSAYALLPNEAGDLAVMRTPKGHFLPGGGVEPGESVEAAVAREAREEAGLVVEASRTIGEAIEFTRALDEDAWYQKVSTFVGARVVGHADAAEPDHELLWLSPARAADALTPPSHRWAVERFAAGHIEPRYAPAYVARLRAVVDAAERALAAVSDADSARRPAPGTWSPREVVGHLVDSAANNHVRFVRAQTQADLVFPGYAQDAWVEAQGYATAPWRELVTLWALYNRHLARVMARVPEAVRERPHARHNLDEIAWRPVPAHEPATLDYFMADYVGHLEHHLRRVLGAEWYR